ncbi:hypothetical protein P154DRAFT_476076 [Amniculicola lignicola CBS 123094]|uniref:Extracellular membrane protein CFEM domain-containing protein n=1 Tax=Amniculicola lignicola CBS 123094 TaxID=1392246 RepID=A0A6A5VXV1_9PLEO|nr:hypothetical protein P154DRAFT_476076 [Amniculicola lignicola CBS 123094]
MNLYTLLIALGALFCLVYAGFVPPAEWCLPTAHLKELSGCIAMTDKEDECGAKESEKEKLDCYCTQEMLSSYFACKDDIRRCLESNMFDNQFDTRVRRWHEACDSRFTTTALSTPPVTSLTATYDFGACERLKGSCISADYETNKCSETFLPTSSLSYLSCACQPPVYSLFSECQYNGNVSCMRTTAAESNILGYSVCSYFWTGSETLSSIDLTSMMSGFGSATPQATGLTEYIPATHVASVASFISSTVPMIVAKPKWTPPGQLVADENVELR